MEKKSFCTANVIFLAVCAILIFGFGAAIFILPQENVSEDENRSLQKFPSFDIEALADGSFTDDVADFYSDQFPMRSTFVGIKSVCELSLLRQENNQTIVGRNGYLISRLEYTDFTKLNSNTNFLCKLQASSSVPVAVYIAPRSIDVNKTYLPADFSSERSDSVLESLESSGLDYISGRDTLKELCDNGEYVWYKTDHHWTTLGAYRAYCELGKVLGFTPAELTEFTVEQVSDSFLGTTYSSSGIKWATPDTVEYFRFDGDTSYKTEIYSNSMKLLDSFDSFYNRNYLLTKDKYGSFISSNNAITKIYQPGQTKPTLLVVKDSFANSVAPFLARHFDLILLDLREYGSTVSDFIAENHVDAVLVLCGIDSLVSYDYKIILQ